MTRALPRPARVRNDANRSSFFGFMDKQYGLWSLFRTTPLFFVGHLVLVGRGLSGRTDEGLLISMQAQIEKREPKPDWLLPRPTRASSGVNRSSFFGSTSRMKRNQMTPGNLR